MSSTSPIIFSTLEPHGASSTMAPPHDTTTVAFIGYGILAFVLVGVFVAFIWYLAVFRRRQGAYFSVRVANRREDGSENDVGERMQLESSFLVSSEV